MKRDAMRPHLCTALGCLQVCAVSSEDCLFSVARCALCAVHWPASSSPPLTSHERSQCSSSYAQAQAEEAQEEAQEETQAEHRRLSAAAQLHQSLGSGGRQTKKAQLAPMIDLRAPVARTLN